MEQGDFNGDGLADLIYLEDNGSWINAQIMYNNGNYTFTKGFAGRFFAAPIYNDEMLTMLTSDLNNDGRSDLVIIRQLEKSTSNVVWALMDGLSFKQVKQLDIPSESESKPSNILLGCFNINGGFSVAHVGMYNLYNGSKSPIEKLYIYGNHNVTNDNGKIVNVIDGLGRTTSIEYSSILDNTIYDNGSEVRYPLCKPMSIIPLVKRIIKNETDITEYKYGGFVHHQIRKGLLSPDYFYSEDLSKKQSISYSVLSRDTITFQPIECLTIKKQGEKQLTSKEYHSVYNINNNSFRCLSKKETVDFYGRQNSLSYDYNITDGTIQKSINNFSNGYMEESIYYDGYIAFNGLKKPTMITTSRVMEDAQAMQIKQKYEYDESGNNRVLTTYYGAPEEISIQNDFDLYGNIISTKTIGNSISENTTYTIYDINGIQVQKKYSGAGLCNEFTYDHHGNLLTEMDKANPSEYLVLEHEYDAWGREIKCIFPTGLVKEIVYGWGADNDYRSFIEIYEDDVLQCRRWFNVDGQLTKEEGTEFGNLNYTTEINYNKQGTYKKEMTFYGGDLQPAVTEKWCDELGRLETISFSPRYTQEIWSHYPDYTCHENKYGYEEFTYYDKIGNIISYQDELGSNNYEYDLYGRIIKVQSADGLETKIEYDLAGRKTKIVDPDAGEISYTYSADGRMLSRIDADRTVKYNYDEVNRLETIEYNSSKSYFSTSDVIKYIYGTTGNEKDRLIKIQRTGSMESSIEYEYDEYGRVICEKYYNGAFGNTNDYQYKYDRKGNVVEVTFPGGMIVKYTYDEYGNKNGAYLNGQLIYAQGERDALISKVQFPNGYIELKKNEYYYLPESTLLSINDSIIFSLNTHFDPSMEYLRYRLVNIPSKVPVLEYFMYDELGRLCGTRTGEKEERVELSNTGSVLFKTQLGDFEYGSSSFENHRITSVSNDSIIIPSGNVDIYYNPVGDMEYIEASNYYYGCCYGPDLNKWATLCFLENENGSSSLMIEYCPNYECIIQDGVKREFYFVDDIAVIYRENDGSPQIYYIGKDHLGSIYILADSCGNVVFEASYDSWGKQTIYKNEIGFIHGFAGHEELHAAKLVHMGSRLYDPVLGSFISPDNNIQLEWDTQGFNRYSYCRNNPLLYTDNNGQWFGLDDLIVGAVGFVAGYVSSGIKTGNWGWSSVVSGLKGAATSWIGYNTAGLTTGAVNSAMWNQAASMGVNIAANNLLPTAGFRIGCFNFGLTPMIGYGSGVLNIGVGASVGVQIGDVTLGGGFGGGTGYYGWNATASYGKWGVGFGQTTYSEGSFHNNSIQSQKVGTATVKFPGGSFRLSNDLLGDKGDRWRSSAAELTIGGIVIGTSVFTNDGDADSKIIKETNNLSKNYDETVLALNPVGSGRGAWLDGRVFSAPVWVGISQGGNVYRFGFNHQQVQNLTQNLVHKVFGCSRYYNDYKFNNFSGYSYFGTNNPFTLWNY